MERFIQMWKSSSIANSWYPDGAVYLSFGREPVEGEYHIKGLR
jgi:hypothetical protein